MIRIKATADYTLAVYTDSNSKRFSTNRRWDKYTMCNLVAHK